MFINLSELRILFCVEFSMHVKLTINSEFINVYVFTTNGKILVIHTVIIFVFRGLPSFNFSFSDTIIYFFSASSWLS